jgi:exopolysaccharide biosynthesis polyprenyl glycosylphosphotransferase
MKRSEFLLTAFLVPLDLLMIVAAFLAAYYLRFAQGQATVLTEVFWPIHQYLAFVGVIIPFWLVVFALSGLYSVKKTWRAWEEFSSIFVGVAGGTILVIAWPFLTRQDFFSRLIVIYLFILALLFVTVGRTLLRTVRQWLYRYGIGVHRLVIIGTNGVADRFIREIQADTSLGFRVVGRISGQKGSTYAQAKTTIPLLGRVADDLEEITKGIELDDILIADPELAKSTVLSVLEFAEQHGLNFSQTPNLLDVHSMNIAVQELAGLPILEYRRTSLEGWGMILKRIIDLGVSTCLILLTSPVMLLAAIAIKLDSRGPVFFHQLDDGSPTMRIGQHGKPFRYFKFRSMQPRSHSLRYTALQAQNVRSGPLVKIKDDPRITRVGKWLRKLSVDELPELFLVWIGKMSLVGPRPHLPEEVAKYAEHHRRVLMTKPGMTGMAQVSGRSDLDFDEEVRLDTYYIENWSFWLDLRILLRTPLAVLASRSKKAGD